MLKKILKMPFRAAVASPAIRDRLVFELRQNHYASLGIEVPLTHGLVCPILSNEAWSSYGEIFVNLEYEEALDLIPSPRRWIDLGCHMGYFSLYTAWRGLRQGGGPGDALLVDADMRAATAAGALIARNGPISAWKAVCGAVAEGHGTRSFVQRAYMDSSLASPGGSEEGVSVQVLTPQAIADALSPPYDLIKCDIEGGEYALLKAYEPVLRASRYLLMEWHAFHPGGGGKQQILELAAHHGFEPVPLSAKSEYVRDQMGLVLLRNRAFAHL